MKTKKLIDTAFVYAIAAMVWGVFYREFTKFFAFSGKTTLAVTHVHFFALGTLVFLLLALFNLHLNLWEQPQFRWFYRLYNIALPYMVILFTVRGVLQVLGTPLRTAANAAISGISGIGHILMAVSIVLLFLALRRSTASLNK